MQIKQLVLTIALLGTYCLYGNAQTVLNEKIDEGDAFLFGCQELKTTGIYHNDDNTVTLNLTVCAPNVVNAGEATITLGDSYLFGCTTYTPTASGDMELRDTAVLANGCDSITYMTLHVLEPVVPCTPSTTDLGEATITLGESFLFGCNVLTPASAQDTILQETLQNVGGCDSTVTLTLHVLEPVVPCTPSTTDLGEATITLGESFLFGCNVLTPASAQDTILQETLQNVGGCDSTVTLILHVLEPVVPCVTVLGDTIRDTIQLGESYLFGCTVYKPSQDTIVADSSYTAINGCDSVAILKLHVYRFEYDTIYLDPVCKNEPIAVLKNQMFTKDTLILNFDTTTGFTPDTIHSYQVYIFKEPNYTDITVQKVLDKGAMLTGKQGKAIDADLIKGFKDSIQSVFNDWSRTVQHPTTIEEISFLKYEDGGWTEWTAAKQAEHIARHEDSISIIFTIKMNCGELESDPYKFYTEPWDTIPATPVEIKDTLCYGETFELYPDSIITVEHDITLVRVDTVKTTAQDYDSLTVYNITVNMPSDTTKLLNIRGFYGDSIFIAGDTITTTKADTVNLTNVNGCDSVVVYSVIIPEVETKDIKDTVCVDSEYSSRNGLHTITGSTQWSDTVWCGSATEPDSIYRYDIYVYNFELPIAAPTDVTLYCGDTIDFSGDIATVEAAIAADPLFAPNTTIEWYIVDADGNLTAAKNYVVSAENQSLKLVYKLINNECGTSLTSAEATFDVVPHTDSLDIIKGKFGDFIIIVDKNLVDTTIARPAGATLSDEGTEVTWYRVGTGANGEDEILDWKTEAQSKNGYYIAAKERAALTGSYYVVINIQGANGCGSVIRSNIWECATPTAATPRLTPNRVNAGEPMWLIDLNAEEDTHVRIYDASGKMMNELHYNAAQQQLIPTVGTSGMYLLHVVNGAVETTLKYMLK